MNGFKLKTSKKIYKNFLVLSFFLFVVALVFQMRIANKAVVKGKDFHRLYVKKKSLQKEIAYLSFKNSELSALSSVESRALELGFMPLNDSLYVVPPVTLAVLNTQ